MNTKLKIKFNAPVVLGFVFLCFGATLLGYITAGKTNQLLFMTYHSSLMSPMTYLRFFTHIFGHADWEHLIGNMCYILLLGPLLEEKYSSGILLEAIGVTALITGIINYIFFPQIALCGASGVVFAFMILSSFTSFKRGEIPLTFILVVIFFMGQQVIEGVTVKDDISNMAHIVGGIVGGLIGYCLNKKPGSAMI
ncbi:MAG: rhomboid family intramembrane serine protease [Lachnoclostridium edouardi]|uniref:rhomboid family intramembrane serine protease n=1 Tax=Lachnoclostridium edouardi TaxID=1926283 RepID=UPI0026DBCC31|nr:rhomboid family intramembrane serine protease [Lachnoclostridium edouardi]MDO4279890.1 rhomboid family intramembrane serine protease [Lachnoclostridium edouardi]